MPMGANKRKTRTATSTKRPATAQARPDAKRRKVSKDSYDQLWQNPEVTKGWKERGAKYWKATSADLEGMTGGGVTRADLAFSKKTLEDVMKVLAKRAAKGVRGNSAPSKKFFAKALEVGAGIGRVSKGLLRHHCQQLHLVEFVKEYVEKAKVLLKPCSDCRFDFTCSSAQKFRIRANNFDLIWCQWLLMYLTDADVLDFLRRCSAGLTVSGGVLVIKENVMKAFKNVNKYFEDANDSEYKPGSGKGPVSCVRTRKHFEHLFKKAGLRIAGSRMQPDGESFETMYFWALEPLDRVSKGNRRLLA